MSDWKLRLNGNYMQALKVQLAIQEANSALTASLKKQKADTEVKVDSEATKAKAEFTVDNVETNDKAYLELAEKALENHKHTFEQLAKQEETDKVLKGESNG